jgi:hypothetical protein
VFQTGRERSPESTRICEEPETTLWRRTRLVTTVGELLDAVRTTASEFTVAKFGILAHGDVGGYLQVGKDEIDLETIGHFSGSIALLDRYLAPGADIFIFGCTSGFGRQGSAFLKEWSRLLPGRRVIGFNFVNTLVPVNPHRVEDVFCFDPEVWATSVRNFGEFNDFLARNKNRLPTVNEATDSAPQAKIALDGRIVKWPGDEDAKKDDAELKDLVRSSKPADQLRQWREEAQKARKPAKPKRHKR